MPRVRLIFAPVLDSVRDLDHSCCVDVIDLVGDEIFLADGSDQTVGTFSSMSVWTVSSVDGTVPLVEPYKTIQGTLTAINADSWLMGSTAT